VSIVQSRPRRRYRSLPQRLGLASICRARRIVRTLGGRFSLELGMDLDNDPHSVERWALAATLLGNAKSTSVALRTYRVLDRAGVRAIEDTKFRSREELVALLDEAGYVGHDEDTALRLRALADYVADRYDGRFAALADSQTLERELQAMPGWAPVTAGIFLRELRGVLPGVRVPLEPGAALAARHLQLPDRTHTLSHLASIARLDFRDLEAALTRLALVHEFAGCPGGEECPYAAFDREQFVHF
jgi:hypothetical protein